MRILLDGGAAKPQRSSNMRVSAAWMPPIDTCRWKKPAGACGRDAAPVSTPAPSVSTSAATAPPAAPSDDPSTAPADPTPEAEASGTAPAIAACSTADITVLAVTDKDAYAAGEQPQLSITLSNNAATPCLINVGTATQSFVITSGSDTWWRSTDCQSESSDQVVQLAAGQTVSSVTPVVWDRTRSSVDSCGSSRPQAPAGYFHLQVSIGGIEAADTRMFELR